MTKIIRKNDGPHCKVRVTLAVTREKRTLEELLKYAVYVNQISK